MGRQIRDDRQLKAFTGLSQAPCHPLRPLFSDLDQTTQQKTSADGVKAGTRRRQPGGGANGTWRTLAATWPWVL